MPKRALTPTSYIILGLLRHGPGTPYDLKNRAAATVGHFWSVQHAQLYTETAKLAADGLLTEKRESEGRRRKTYAITESGRRALADWLATPTTQLIELRDLGMLKTFFGADLSVLAPAQLEAHRQSLARLEQRHKELKDSGIPQGMMLTLEAGIGHEREYVRYWSKLV
jgi:DNA-binding PadR family transcriptional regulator